MSSAYPRVVKNWNAFVDGVGYAGRCDEVTLPVLNMLTEDHRAGGMDLPVEIEMGMERLEATMVFSDVGPELLRQIGLVVNNALPITVRAAVQAMGDPARGWVFNMRGGWASTDLGTWTPGTKSTITCRAALTYFKATYEREVIVEIDALNLVRRIGGVDQLATQRGILGF